MKKSPDIFNDIIGPVMRGPSSSHTAASWRIAKTSIDILNEQVSKALIEFADDGAWAPNYREQGTCMGINGGLLGLDITDEQMKDADQVSRERGLKIDYRVSEFETKHANTVRLNLWGSLGKMVQVLAISTGGGAFEIQSIDGFDLSIKGDLYEIIVFSNEAININLPKDIQLSFQEKEDTYMYQLKSSQVFSSDFITSLRALPSVKNLSMIHPVLPVLSGKQMELPFSSIASLLDYAKSTKSDLGDLGLVYEKCLSGFSVQELKGKMVDIINVIHKSIDTGLRGTEYADRILPQQSHLIAEAEKKGKIKDSIVNRIISYVSALMESKSSMEVIVAVPTAGSCGTVGGSLRALAENINASDEDLQKAYFASGLVGAYFAMGPGFSAEEHGCQVECGAASGMAAAGLAQLMGASAEQTIAAASMAIQNMIGLVCDPVADRVEVPCLGKNVSAAVNAYSSAIMAVAGYREVIPLDQVIETVAKVSETMPTCVKCTGLGGLAITNAASEIKMNLEHI